jgi:hypothetical protein
VNDVVDRRRDNYQRLLKEFRDAVEEAKQAIEGLEIEAASHEVIDAVHELRQKAEDLIASADLPEGARVVIDQLVQQLGHVDVKGAVKGPVDEALEGFKAIEGDPPLSARIADAQKRLENIVPKQLGAALEAEVEQALETVRSFKPENLRAAIQKYLDDAADAIEGIDLDPALALARKPFSFLLEAVDAVKPDRLLEPVFAEYDRLLGAIPAPDPKAAASKTLEAVSGATEALSKTLAQPVTQLAGEGALEVAQAHASGAIPKPGDAVRLLGYLPRKLHEALAKLDHSAAGEVAREIDRLTGGLARDLRGVRAALWEIDARLAGSLEELLAPLAVAQVRAQLALEVHFAVDGAEAAAEVDVEAWVSAVALAGPGPLRSELATTVELARGEVRRAATAAGGETGVALERIAAALERSSLAGLEGDVDRLLTALDPEPLAAELDAFADAVLQKAPQLLTEVGDELTAAFRRFQALVLDLNPGVQAQRFLQVLDVLREELDLLNPRRLAEELDEVHAAIRAAVEAYDPTSFGPDLKAILQAIATHIRTFDPAEYLGPDALKALDETVKAVEDAVPTKALEDVGTALDDAAKTLDEIDLAGLAKDIEALLDRVEKAFDEAIDDIDQEINALIGSLRYQSANSPAGGSATVSVG